MRVRLGLFLSLVAGVAAPAAADGPPVALSIGVADPGSYGNGFGSDAHEIELIVTFASAGTDLDFYVTGWDIDFTDEVSVYLNGGFVGHLSKGPNENVNAGNRFRFLAIDQLPGTNTIRIVERVAGWKWGVSGLLVAEAVAPGGAVALTMGEIDPGAYGNGFGSDVHETELTATFTSEGTDVDFHVTGWDVDFDDEVSVYLNGGFVGQLSEGPNDDLNAGDRFRFLAGDQLPGTNTIRIVERVAGWKWGVSGLLVAEATAPTADVVLILDETDPGSYGNGFGSDVHETELTAIFTSEGTDLDFHVTGWDIDFDDEVSVYLNGGFVGQLSEGPNESLNAGDRFRLLAVDQVPDVNTLRIVQRVAGWKWGVTGLRVANVAVPTDPPAITSTPRTSATVGVPYQYDDDGTVEATGALPITFALESGPAGMIVSPGGAVSFTPAPGQDGTQPVQIRATNGFGSDVQSFDIAVTMPSGTVPLTIGDTDPGSYGSGFGSDAHETELIVTFTSEGTDLDLFVTGWDIDFDDEVSVDLNGTPLGHLKKGPNNKLNAGDTIRLLAADQRPGANTVRFVERVAGWKWGVTGLLVDHLKPLSIVDPMLPDAGIDLPYSQTLLASGGTAPYAWSLSGGALPPELALDASGTILGTPTSAGSYAFTVRVVDALAAAVTRDVTLVVSPFVAGDFGHPYVQHPKPDGATIVWWTKDGSAGTLEYGAGTLTGSVASDPEEITLTAPDPADWVTRYKHEMVLTGLDPDTTYAYRVTQRGGIFDSTFETAPADPLTPIRFLVWADTETQVSSPGSLGAGAPAGYPMDEDEGIRAGVLASHALDPDFILIAGDIVEQGGRRSDWDEFFRKVNDKNRDYYDVSGPLASRVPFFAVPGNHDYFGYGFAQPGSEDHALHKFGHHFANPSNTAPTIAVDPTWPSEIDPSVRAAQNERYYAFEYGPVTVIAIDVNNQSPNGSSDDTNFNILGENEAGGGHAPDWLPGSRQYAWLEEELARAELNSLFTFVFWHHSPYGSGGHSLPPGIDDQSGRPTRQLDALLHRYRVTAVFSGHEEMVEMSETTGVLAEGGDPSHTIRYFIPGTVGDGIRSPLTALLNPNRVFQYADSPIGRHYGFLDVTIAPDPGDPTVWKATFRQAWINPEWADDPSLDPLGGYYDSLHPEAFFEASAVP